ncbi:MAG: hypothetical protein ABIN89_18970 [Chitinophagaceae bacterium]
MFNPFSTLSVPLLDAFVKSGKKYFVRQTFTRGKSLLDEGVKGYFIFTHYSEIGHAQHHLGAIEHDPNRFLYEWDNQEHQQKLIIAAGTPPGYKIYSSVFEKDWQKWLTVHLKDKVKKYIDYRLGWKPGGGETVDFQIYSNYGDLYAKLKLRSQEVRVKLELIENG